MKGDLAEPFGRLRNDFTLDHVAVYGISLISAVRRRTHIHHRTSHPATLNHVLHDNAVHHHSAPKDRPHRCPRS